MIAVGVGILVALVATVVFFVVYNSSRKGWQQSLAVRESEAADLKGRNGWQHYTSYGTYLHP